MVELLANVKMPQWFAMRLITCRSPELRGSVVKRPEENVRVLNAVRKPIYGAGSIPFLGAAIRSWISESELTLRLPKCPPRFLHRSVMGYTSARRKFGISAGIPEHMSSETKPIRVLVVDDHPLIREGIAALIMNQADFKLVGEASDGRQAITEFRTHLPDVTLMDLQMPDIDGVDAIIAIRSEFPKARIIVLTTYGGDVLAQRALKAGAQAYLLKNDVRKGLLDTIRAVHTGRKQIDSKIASELADHASDDALTRREVEVLSLIAAGNSNKLIADRLSITDETVKGHVSNILSKLGASDRTHAVTLALKRGIIQL